MFKWERFALAKTFTEFKMSASILWQRLYTTILILHTIKIAGTTKTTCRPLCSILALSFKSSLQMDHSISLRISISLVQSKQGMHLSKLIRCKQLFVNNCGRTSAASFNVHAFDEHFMWNQFLISGLMDFRSKMDKDKQQKLDRGGFLVSLAGERVI